MVLLRVGGAFFVSADEGRQAPFHANAWEGACFFVYCRLDTGKTEISRQRRLEWYNGSPEFVLSEKRRSFPGLDPEQSSQNTTLFLEVINLRRIEKYCQQGATFP